MILRRLNLKPEILSGYISLYIFSYLCLFTVFLHTYICILFLERPQEHNFHLDNSYNYDMHW